MKVLYTFVPLALVLAGCIGSGDDEVPVAPAAGIDGAVVDAYAMERLIQSHDHEAAHEEHAGIIGLTVTGHSASDRSEGYGELVVKGDHAYLATSSASGFVDPMGHGGFILYDISDPTAPVQVGRWEGQPLGDLEVSDDGAYAFASTQRNGYPYTWTLPPTTPAAGILPRGTAIVDVSDPTAPATVGYMPLPPNGPHTVNYHKMPDGTELLFAMTYDILFTAYPDDVGQLTATQKVVIYRFDRAPVPTLVPLSIFQIPGGIESVAQYFPHDATAHTDPTTGRVIMDIAYWDRGLILVDITDPTSPVELARFADTAPSEYVSTHLVRVFPGTIDGRTVAVMEPEIPTGSDTGTITLVDVSDPAKPTKLGTWMMPGDLVIDIPFKFSPHNFDPVCAGNGQATGKPIDYSAPCLDPYIVLSHNHGGLWVLDASDPTDPRSAGFFFPAKTDDGPVPSGFGTAFVQDGVIYAPEYRTGLYTLRLDANVTGIDGIEATV